MFWVKKKFGSKNFWGQKKIGSEISLSQKNFVLEMFLEKKFGSEIFLGQKKLIRKFFWVQKIRVGQKFGSKKIWVGNLFGSKKIWVEIFFGRILFWSYKISLCYSAVHCWLEQQKHRVCLWWVGGLHVTHPECGQTNFYLAMVELGFDNYLIWGVTHPNAWYLFCTFYTTCVYKAITKTIKCWDIKSKNKSIAFYTSLYKFIWTLDFSVRFILNIFPEDLS